ncbi:MAG: hypothetical protein KGI80_02715 [Verrucomicrobiota bacterium]|nr:hypothetical protein [Verrucomicrobiota bacterium]
MYKLGKIEKKSVTALFSVFPLKKGKYLRVRLITIATFCIISALVGWSIAQLSLVEQGIRKAKEILNHLQSEITRSHAKIALPRQLATFPFAETTGVVTSTKSIAIRSVIAPYNPSLIPATNGAYTLFFRYNLLHPSYHSCIGTVPLNSEFTQGEKEFRRLSLHSKYAEDPRACFVDNQLYLFYSTLHPENSHCRMMCIANLDPDTFATNYVTALDLNTQWVERNWCPFEYVGIDDKRELLIEYQLSPRKLLSLPDPQVNDLRSIPLPHNVTYTLLPWASRWGQIRGGTPAQRIGNEYLSFFHSSFKEEDGTTWYVMGAYTFLTEPPFTITKMSSYPILFRSIYDTPPMHTADTNKRVIFPAGFVIDKDRIHLACGENDCAIKIITFDKQKLLASLAPLH